MKPNGGGKKLPGALEKAIDEDLGGFDKFRADFIQAGRDAVRLGLGWLAVKDGKLGHQDAERREPAGPRRARRSSAATCGSTPTTSTTATAGRSISRAFFDSLVNWDYVEAMSPRPASRRASLPGASCHPQSPRDEPRGWCRAGDR